MRIYAGWTAGIFQVGQTNPAMNQRHTGNALSPAAAGRSDTAVISPQGKASSMLANLMNQKELIQMNKESLIRRSLDEENGTVSSGLKEQLEEYEKQLEELDRQIASEMAGQTENDPETEKTYQNPQNINGPEGADENIARLTEVSVDLDKDQVSARAQNRREGEKRVCEAEIEGGSAAAELKLEEIEEKEQLTAQIKPVLLMRLHS